MHKPPMKSILRIISNGYSIYKALDAANKEYGTDFIDSDIIKWNHISKEDAIIELKKLHSEQNPERSIATGLNQGTKADNQIKQNPFGG